MDCGLVIDNYYVNFEAKRHSDDINKVTDTITHELTPEYLKGSVIAYGEVLKNMKGRQRGVFRRLVKVQRQSAWWDDTYLRRIGVNMTEFMRQEGFSYEIRNLVDREWRHTVSKWKEYKNRTIFLSHMAVSVIYAVVKRYKPTYRLETLIDYFGEDSSISSSEVIRIIMELKIPYQRPTKKEYIEVGIQSIAPMYYTHNKDVETFIPRLRENVRKLYDIVGVGGEDDMNLLSAILYGACHIESINKRTRLPRTVTTPRVAEKLGMLPFTVRCVYNRKVKEVVEKYREQRKK